MKTCECNESLSNLGTPNCKSIFKVAKKLIFVPTYDSAGDRNSITVASAFTPAVLTALLNQSDGTKRWYPTPLLENVTSERSESAFETAPSGRKAFVKQGTRSMSSEIWEESSAYKGQLDAIRCNDVSVYIIDAEGSIRGTVAEDEALLFPIKVDNNSFDAMLMFGTDSIIEKLKVGFDWDQTEDDASLRMIGAGDITADLLNAGGLLDFSIEYGAITSTSVTFTLVTSVTFGSLKTKLTDKGLIISDFALFNVTDNASLSELTLTEAAGIYTINFDVQDASDIIRITPSKNGRDYSNVVSNTFVAV